MSTAENKALVRRLYDEVWNKRRIEVVHELISPSHALSGSLFNDSSVGPEAYKRILAQFIAAFPDLRFAVGDMIAEKDHVVVSWVISGTHKREFRGIAATNKKVSVDGVTIHQIARGRILDSDVRIDHLGLLQQLGSVRLTAQPKTAAAT
ncbi:MAG TPA: ester cyclase [Candidatus Methylomirabilis sp.]|nr:ester cyclase [Candidatus Methylomirabilis sp.]